MADVDQKLFQELKFLYPEVPDNIVADLMSQLGNDRDRCLEMLANESSNYLFCQPSNNSPDPLAHFSCINISESRPHHDLSGSNMSKKSASGTPSRPPYNTSHSLINIPGYRGPIITVDTDRPPTAPVVSNDINRFKDIYSNKQTQDLPNVNCNNSGATRSSRPLNISVMDYISNSDNQASCSSQTVLRPIDVQHIQTSKETRDTNISGSSQPNVLYQIRIDPSQGTHVTPSNQQQTLTSNSGCWLRSPMGGNSAYQNVIYPNSKNTLYCSDPRAQQYDLNSGPASPYKSLVDDHRSFNQYGPQNSSQATIYLQNPAAASGNNVQCNAVPLVDRNLNSPLPGQYNHSYNHSSVNDPGLAPNILRNTVSQSNPQAGGHIVLIKTPRRDGGVQSHIQYFNKIANSSLAAAGQPSTPQNAVIGNMTPLNENPASDIQNSVTRPSYIPERPNMINIQGHNASRNESGFLKFSQQLPNECRVPGHYPHGPCHKSGNSFEIETGYVSDTDHRCLPTQTAGSPIHNVSSVGSESSAASQRPLSGSSQDDPAYLQVLLSHQKSRMEKLYVDLNLAENRLHDLKRDVTEMESHAIERQRNKSSRFPSSVDLARMRGENLQLQADIQLMTREIDLFNNGQTPLGVLDPLEQQNFYKNMNTGQSGSIYASTGTTSTPKLCTSSVTTSVTAPAATTSTRPPPEIPPQLPPRELRREVPPPRPPRTVAPISYIPPPSPQQLAIIGDADTDGEQWSCSACTLLNHPALNKCECCEMPRMNIATSSISARDEPDTFPSVQNASST